MVIPLNVMCKFIDSEKIDAPLFYYVMTMEEGNVLKKSL
jgi:hypothetical protein